MFQGFAPPTSNYSKLPHAFIEHLPLITSLGEMKVILYILRHTWGFQDDDKKITLDEFANGRKQRDGSRLDKGTGLTKPTIMDGIKRAVEHGFIIVETDKRDLGRVKKFYSLAMNGVKKLDPAPPKDFDMPGKESLPRTEKETIERNYRKKQECATAPAPPPPEPTPPRTRKKSERDGRMDSLVKAFCDASELSAPALNTDKQKKAAGALWFGPLSAMAKVCDNDVERTGRLMKFIIEAMDSDGLTISSPNSIKKSAIAEQARRKRTNGKPQHQMGHRRNGKQAPQEPVRRISKEQGELLRRLRRERKEQRLAAAGVAPG